MPRFPAQLRRRIQVQLAAAMLLLAAIFGLAWALSIAASWYVARSIYVQPYAYHSGSTGIVVDGGRVLFTEEYVTRPYDDPRRPRQIEWRRGRFDRTTTDVRTYDAPRWANRVGFDWRWTTQHATAPYPHTRHERHLSVPFWLMIALCATSGWLLGRRNRLIRRRVIAGQCPACGYDCRATPARCPECGYRGAGDEDRDDGDDVMRAQTVLAGGRA
jgi:hypothetical protein